MPQITYCEKVLDITLLILYNIYIYIYPSIRFLDNERNSYAYFCTYISINRKYHSLVQEKKRTKMRCVECFRLRQWKQKAGSVSLGSTVAAARIVGQRQWVCHLAMKGAGAKIGYFFQIVSFLDYDFLV